MACCGIRRGGLEYVIPGSNPNDLDVSHLGKREDDAIIFADDRFLYLKLGSFYWDIIDFICITDKLTRTQLITMCILPGQTRVLEETIRLFCLRYINDLYPDKWRSHNIRSPKSLSRRLVDEIPEIFF